MPSLTLVEALARSQHLTVSSYDVELDLDRGDTTFGSRTTVRFRARGPVDTFVDVAPAHLVGAWLNGAPLEPSTLADGRLPLRGVDGDNELLVDAVMAYRRDGEGLHRAVDPADGKVYTYAMSFLDAAPSIFACFDQPDLKAPYTFRVSVPPDWVVVGNGRAEEVEPGRWELAPTEPLSTYLVTVVAGPYHQVAAEHDGIALGLECRASLAEHLDREAEEILTVTRQCFDEFHRLFGVRYPFGDYHQAFVPEFNAGAMENPGCVTFRDPLVFSSRVTRAERAGRATTIAHEMAHQWFGDLVTPRWWDDLWLNESFAEYMGTRVAADVTEFSDAFIETAFGRKRWGIEADQRPSTHPVAGNGAADARAALQDFDGISYVKGSALLRQLRRNVGDEVFLGGVRTHLREHAFGNATMDDLVGSWSAAGAGDLSSWVDSWLRTAGVDLLEVERSASGAGVVRHTPPERPADRVHALSVAVYDGSAGWDTREIAVSAAPAPLPHVAADRPVVLDPADESWARLGMDPPTLSAMPGLLPLMTDPLMRAAVWAAVRDGVAGARIDPHDAVDLLVAALPHEDQDVAVGTLSAFGRDVLLDRFLAEPADAADRLHQAALDRLASAPPSSGLQLAAVRAAVSTCGEEARLRAWLSAAELPDGVEVDRDLRWRLLTRLAGLGCVDRDELDRHFDLEPTTDAGVHRARALASFPEEAAKQRAWEYLTGEREGSNYEVEAAGHGLWQRGQEALTAAYVDRYFAELPGTAGVREGWALAGAARAFYPGLAVAPSTVARARRLLEDSALEVGLRRTVVDSTDDLERAVLARSTYPGRS